MVIPPDFGFLMGWLMTQHYEHEYHLFFCRLIVSRYSLFLLSFSLRSDMLPLVVVTERLLLDISLAIWLA
jgi:hypothetical protein